MESGVESSGVRVESGVESSGVRVESRVESSGGEGGVWGGV